MSIEENPSLATKQRMVESREAHSLGVKELLYEEKLEYQEILVFKSSTYGKVLANRLKFMYFQQPRTNGRA
ncbi:hypothetical protein HS088_TW16G00208 [Tripterygium wilfordii]|uniref:PABS domain-containing protein n=1 Tax=Tripterygium wilfordii TaxID=458696 RepID=A0A7J7CI85_TRIWF|nr:hypothetical protein HS088_TW16G00208 [Tripterygium wilfordii]